MPDRGYENVKHNHSAWPRLSFMLALPQEALRGKLARAKPR
jgi:hypothetical protein